MRSIKLTKNNIKNYMSQLIAIDGMYSSPEDGIYSREIWGSASFMLELPGKWKNSWVICKEEKVCAFSICSMTDKHTLHIHRLAVHKDYKGTGVSDLLMHTIFLGVEADRITLMVSTENVRAVRYYKKHGFEIVSGEELVDFLNLRNVSAYHIGDILYVDNSSCRDSHYVMCKKLGGKYAEGK